LGVRGWTEALSVPSLTLMRLERRFPVLAELGDWIVTGVAAAGAKVVARCSQMHLDDAVRIVWKMARTKHATVSPHGWMFQCHSPGNGGRSVYYRVTHDGLFLAPLEVLSGGRA
jgi:hypothetical protein